MITEWEFEYLAVTYMLEIEVYWTTHLYYQILEILLIWEMCINSN